MLRHFPVRFFRCFTDFTLILFRLIFPRRSKAIPPGPFFSIPALPVLKIQHRAGVQRQIIRIPFTVAVIGRAGDHGRIVGAEHRLRDERN